MYSVPGPNLNISLHRQRQLLRESIILTPVDSLPIYDAASIDLSYLEGLYSTDRPREPAQIMASKIFFGGRQRMTYDARRIYDAWSKALGAEDATMRVLSGLHAHSILAMGLGSIGDRVLLLPEEGGGHFATKDILERLGFHVIHLPIDQRHRQVDIPMAHDLIDRVKPVFLFIDRSEGLNFEDFSELVGNSNCYSVFDASQYLSGILTGYYPHPFDMGFDLIVSSLHKNFPGPQKAILATRKMDENWRKVLLAANAFVSSMHTRSTYLAGFGLNEIFQIETLFQSSLANCLQLDKILRYLGVPTVKRNGQQLSTQHLWITAKSEKIAYNAYSCLERCRIHVNYRKLPYGLGFGLRLGTNAATLQGLGEDTVGELARLISEILEHGFNLKRRHQVRALARQMYKQSQFTRILP